MSAAYPASNHGRERRGIEGAAGAKPTRVNWQARAAARTATLDSAPDLPCGHLRPAGRVGLPEHGCLEVSGGDELLDAFAGDLLLNSQLVEKLPGAEFWESQAAPRGSSKPCETRMPAHGVK